MYIIKFYKPETQEKVLTEKLPKRNAAERWKKMVEDNGYIVDGIEKVKET